MADHRSENTKLLLVEDDEDFISALTSRLKKRNFDVTTDISAEEALDRIKNTDFDVVVADIKLPGMDGIEFLAKVRDHSKELPVILVTGYGSLESAKDAVRLKAVDYLLKPLDNIDELLNPIYKAIHGYKLLLDNRRLMDDLRVNIAELERSERKYRDLFELAGDIIYTVNAKGVITSANKRIEEITKYDRKEIIGKSIEKFVTFLKGGADKARFQKILAKRVLDVVEVKMDTKCGETRLGEMGLRPIEEDDRLMGAQCIVRDITDRKRTEERLKDSESQLLEQKSSLEQKNSALREMLEQIEIEKNRIKDDIFINADRLLIPFLNKLKRKSGSVSAKYVAVIEQSLKELIVPFARKLSVKTMKLSPREIEVCNMIKNGLSSKEIADFLNISHQTAERHRNNVRKKMGIVGKDVNLYSYLQNL
ncbi:response regulator [Candidatus Omnitrophota bacterium]